MKNSQFVNTIHKNSGIIFINEVSIMLMYEYFGNVLCDRKIGEDARNMIMEHMDSNGHLELDLKNVFMVSHSFADEAFGKLLYFMSISELKQRLKILNAIPDVHCVIKYAIKDRMDRINKPKMIMV